MRNYIHIMLCVSLFVAQLVFIIGIDKTENYVSISILVNTISMQAVKFSICAFHFREHVLQ